MITQDITGRELKPFDLVVAVKQSKFEFGLVALPRKGWYSKNGGYGFYYYQLVYTDSDYFETRLRMDLGLPINNNTTWSPSIAFVQSRDRVLKVTLDQLPDDYLDSYNRLLNVMKEAKIKL